MARSLWTGALSFGLVTIPVELHTAVRDLGPHFNLLRESDKSPIGYQKVAKKGGEVVTKDQLVKGYEYEKGRYVVLTEEDFDSAAVKRNRRIDLMDFVGADEVDDRYFDKPYYLLPGKGGEHAYTLLREALRQANRIGIAKFVMHDRPHLAAIQVIKDALVLSTLRFREELVPVSEYRFPKERVREVELKMAHQLIEALVAGWDPDKYTNEYRANLMRIIEAKKRRKQKPDLERQELDADSKVVDLMERLRQSLGQAGHAVGKGRQEGKPDSARRSRASTPAARSRAKKPAAGTRNAAKTRKPRRRAA